MRLVLAAALSLALAAPAFAADEVPAGAEPGVEAVKALMKSSKNARFRKIKVTAAGDVCALVRPSASAERDLEFTWTKTSGEVWLNESPQEADSEFVYGNASLRRSVERADYKAWKACQAG